MIHSTTVRGRRQPKGLWNNLGINLHSVVAELYAKVIMGRVVESTEWDMVGSSVGLGAEVVKTNEKKNVFFSVHLQGGSERFAHQKNLIKILPEGKWKNVYTKLLRS